MHELDVGEEKEDYGQTLELNLQDEIWHPKAE